MEVEKDIWHMQERVRRIHLDGAANCTNQKLTWTLITRGNVAKRLCPSLDKQGKIVVSVQCSPPQDNDHITVTTEVWVNINVPNYHCQ